MSEILELALMPFQLPFMQSAFVVTLMIAIPMALLSCLLVLKGWSLMGDAVSHAVLPAWSSPISPAFRWPSAPSSPA